VDGNLNVATDEERAFVHDALIGSEIHSLVELALGDKGAPRSLDAETKWDVSVFSSADVASPGHFQHSRTDA
jgi:hypothetical protein